MGASTRFGDFTQPESLSTAYESGDRMLLISLDSDNLNPEVPPQRAALHQTAINAAVAAGVQHIAYTSYVDADRNASPIAVVHRETEAMLRESGVAWTALRDQWYADRIIGQAAEMIESGRVLVDPAELGAAYITRGDIAAAAAVVLTTSGHENRVYELTGPERIRRRDIALIASEISGVPIEVIEATPEQMADVPEPLASSETLSTHVADLTGRPGTTARQLLEANRDRLLAARGPR
jgi:NAD(P)H dehydrogenase (quinone)